MNPDTGEVTDLTAPVMARHRTLKGEGMSGLEASRIVLKEALSVGIKGTVERPHESNVSTGANPLTGGHTPTVQADNNTEKTCNACNKPLHNRGDVCNACRQRAYRERQA